MTDFGKWHSKRISLWLDTRNGNFHANGTISLSREPVVRAKLSITWPTTNCACFIFYFIYIFYFAAFVNGLRNEARDVAVSQLLHYLPLLRPNNTDAARGYIHLLPRYLSIMMVFCHLTIN